MLWTSFQVIASVKKEKERKKKKSGPATGFSKCNSESLPFITSRGLWMQSRAKLGLSQLYHMGCHCVTAGRTRDSAVKIGKLLTRKALQSLFSCQKTCFSLSHQKERRCFGVVAYIFVGFFVFYANLVLVRFGCSAVFEAASYALRSFQVELKRSTRGLPWLKLPESRNDVLPKSNSESHRCSRLCPWNGDTAGEVQKERFPGHIPGRLWFSDSLIAAVSNTHTHTQREKRNVLFTTSTDLTPSTNQNIW